VAATLATTLKPTMKLLEEKAELIGKKVQLTPCLIEGAYQQILKGDQAGHDKLLMDAFSTLFNEVDVIVLAQASMAGVAEKMSEEDRARFFSSPALAMKQVKSLLL
jgi:hypothetical protein